MLSRRWLAMLLLLLIASALRAQSPKPGDGMIERFLATDEERLSKRFMDGVTKLDDWEQRKPRLKQEYLEMLGIWPLPEKTPLNAKVTGTIDNGDVTIEKVHFQSRPGLYVTGNFYRPKKVEGKYPTVLYVCGHSNKGRDGNKTAFQDHGMWFASNGFVCLIIATLQLGEIPAIHHGTYREGLWWGKECGGPRAGASGLT